MSGQILTSADLTADVDVSCDVCVVGSGAGGAVLAEGLVDRGLSVVMLEEGGHRTKADFDLQERHAFPMLYQDRGARTTADLAITVLQGRTVGGGTTVNWTTCFRTPERVLDLWRSRFGIEGLSASDLDPHWTAIEERLNIREWPVEAANANNRVLWDGCRALGWDVAPLRRNVDGCVNSGYCGMGCPVDGKQSMLVTFLPDAVAKGLRLYANTKATRLEVEGDRVRAVHAVVLDDMSDERTGRSVVVRPKVVAVCGGAINSPALLLRSGLTDGPVGRRTWLHPVVAVPALFEHRIEGWKGAPQSIGSHHFFDRGDDKVGWFMEVPPVFPMTSALGFPGFGATRYEMMANLPHTSVLISVCVDGLLPGDEGGTVSLRPDGRVRLDYPISPAMQEAFREATRAMARVAIAAGAKAAMSLQDEPLTITSESDLPKLDALSWGAHRHAIFTAHQMGGCAMGRDPATSVVDNDLRHHRVPNLFVVDGSVLPTALGVNPSQTIYGIAHWARDRVAAAS